jgi:hypothetical protein
MVEFSGLLLELLAEPTAVLFGELFKQVIEMADQPITETESVLTGQQASMFGSSPLLVGAWGRRERTWV